VKTKTAIKINNSSSGIPCNKAPKILIIGDSHIRNCAANMKSNTKDNFKVQGVVKSGAEADILANSTKNVIRSLSKSDVVFFGGANDVGRNNSSKALHQIMNFIVNCEHTNITLITVHPRYDLMQSSCVHSEINLFNRKLKKMIKVHHHATVLDIATVRNLFTNHGLHLNSQGKERLANQIVRCIYSILEQKKRFLNTHKVERKTEVRGHLP
jgi:predicted phosphodiesterase